VQPLADLIREVLKGDRLYAVQGNDWYGWWAGRLSDGRQVFAAFGGRSVYYSRWHKMTHPELADPTASKPTLYLALFSTGGGLLDVQTRPDPLRIDPKARARNGVGPEFDVAELEGFLAGEFGGFERAAIRVRPFTIAEIGVQLHPLLDTQAGFLDDPSDYDEEEQASIRAWIEDGCSELLYGNDYFLGGDGEVTSS
jgi:hypothetical protein